MEKLAVEYFKISNLNGFFPFLKAQNTGTINRQREILVDPDSCPKLKIMLKFVVFKSAFLLMNWHLHG